MINLLAHNCHDGLPKKLLLLCRSLHENAVSALSFVSAQPHGPSMLQATRVRPCTTLPLTVPTCRLCIHTPVILSPLSL